VNGVNLSGADLSDADLSKAKLKKAKLSETNLQNAILRSTDLKGVIGLTIEQLSVVKTLYKSKLDSELMEQVKEKYPHLLEKPK